MKLELISFKLCPFVQRAVIMLKHKNVEYDIKYIDINDPPEWFHDVSPTGKVPVLVADDDKVIFESAVIAEFIDEISPGSLHPEDPVLRAQNRAWVEFGSGILGDQYMLLGAKEESEFKQHRQAMIEKLEQLEEEITGPMFNGDELALIDCSMAPMLMRLNLMLELGPIVDVSELPKLIAWKDSLLALDCVKDSVVPEFPNMYRGMIKMRGGFAAGFFGVAE